MRNLTLRQLRYFDALAQYRHFGKAAEALAISQPALSVQIKELEESLGITLFERGHRQVRLTSFGEAFLARSHEVLRNVDELEDLARAAQGRLTGRLRIGIIPTVAPYFLPTLIARVSETHQELELHIREAVTQVLIRELLEGRLDTAIVALPISEPTLAETALFDENFVLVRPTADADKPVPNSEALREMRLLLLEEGHCFRDQALAFCGMTMPRYREVLDSSSLSTLVQMVGAGIGVTLIPEMAVPVETRSAQVSIVHFDDPQPSRTIGMVWRKASPLAEQLAAISELVRDIADDARRSTINEPSHGAAHNSPAPSAGIS